MSAFAIDAFLRDLLSTQLATGKDGKDGNFDWIVDPDMIRQYLSSQYTNIDDAQRINAKVLVVGCGTSTLSASLADMGFGHIVSIDNDPGCIAHMVSSSSSSSSSSTTSVMEWYVYDIVAPENNRADGPISEFLISGGAFDLIIDKGTLDAVLVEGAIYTMLYEVHRLLAPQGRYLVCSLHSLDLLGDLLSTPALGYSVQVHETAAPTVSKSVRTSAAAETSAISATQSALSKDGVIMNDALAPIMTGSIAICVKKDAGFVVDMDQLAEEEREVMDTYYQTTQPLLTPEREEAIRQAFPPSSFEGKGPPSSVRFEEAHRIMFSTEDILDYTYELFLEDLETFPLETPERITVDEAIAFLREKQ
jgi:Methyltransferase domain